MITVYYRKVFPLEEENTFVESLLKKTDKRRLEKFYQTKNKNVQMRHLSAGCLLHEALCENLGISSECAPAFDIRCMEGGKPYLAGKEDVHFNISHSGDYVCVAVGDAPVGVDIQEKLAGRRVLCTGNAGQAFVSCEREQKIAERFFSSADKAKLSLCGEAEYRDLFFKMWSIKESYIKLTGEGMSRGLSGFEIDWQEHKIWERESGRFTAAFWESEEIPGYSLCVCAYLPKQSASVTETSSHIIWKKMPYLAC